MGQSRGISIASSLRSPAGIATIPSFCRVYNKQGQRRMGSKPNMLRITIAIAPFLVLLLSTSTFSSSFAVSMADREVAIEGGGPSKAEVHIVYTEKPVADEPEVFHLRTLATVLGSEEAAKESLLYVYKNAATGFSAKLTPEQVAELSKQPGVLQVVPNMKLQLHSGPGRLH